MDFMTALTGAVVAIVGLTITILSTWAQAEKEANDLYDQMVRLRVEHPVVMARSRRWAPGTFAKVYGEGQESEPEWAIYYSYVELCLSYCNAVLVARHGWRMNRASFTHHHRPLIKLVMTEHNPIIEDLLKEGKFLSRYVKEFRAKLTAEGWDWREEHRKLAD